MFKRLRIAILLYVALIIVAGEWLTTARSTAWNDTLWVDVYPVAGDDAAATRAYIERLTVDELDEIEAFFAREAKRYGVALERPFRLDLAPPIAGPLPALSPDPSVLDNVVWSLRMRWFAAKLQWQSSRPDPDIVVFAVYHDPAATTVLHRSMALEKGLIAVANLFATPHARGSNQIVLAHELLHTLGATDKYDPGTNAPRFPDGYAEPEAEPLLPQRKAELMGGRIPISATSAETPDDFRKVVIGKSTAAEIGWLRAR